MTASRYTPEGGVIQSGVTVNPINDKEHYKMYSLHRGYVVRPVYPEEEENQTGFLEYIVMIEDQEFDGVLDMTHGGGIFNNHTRVRHGATNTDSPGFNLSVDSGYHQRTDGEQVLCLFIGGNGDIPIIIGSSEHTRIEAVNKDYKKPSKALGVYERYEFNGLEFIIDKDGNFSITHLGAKDMLALGDISVPRDPSKLPYKGSFYKILSDGTIQIELNPTTKILINPVTNVMSFENGAGTNFTIDGVSDSFTITNASGMELKLAGAADDKYSFTTVAGTKVEVTGGLSDVILAETAGGAKVTVDGLADEIVAETSAGDKIEMLAGETKMTAGTGGVVKLANEMVGIGGASAELLQQVSDGLQQLSDTALASSIHTHVGNLGYPTSDPDQAAAMAAVGAEALVIKALVDSIKGGI